MADCPACHAVNRDSARYCLNCGHALQPVPATPTAAPPASDSCACPTCGEENRIGRKFCKHCGSTILAATDVTPETASVEPVAVAVTADAPASAASSEGTIEPAADVVGEEVAPQAEEGTHLSEPTSVEPVPVEAVAVELEAERMAVATVAGSEPLVPLFAAGPERARTSAPVAGNEGSSPEVVVVTDVVPVRVPETVLAVAAVPEAPAAVLAGVSQVSSAIDSVVTSLAAGAATVAVETDAVAAIQSAAQATPAPAEVPEVVAPVAPAAVDASKVVAAAVVPALRPWWHWVVGALLLGMAGAAVMLNGVFSRGSPRATAPVSASEPAAIALQPGTGLLREQTTLPAGSSGAVAVVPVVAPVVAPAVAVPPLVTAASEPTPAPAPVSDEMAVPQPMPEIKPATKPATVAAAAKTPPKNEAKASSQHEEIRRKKEELKRQLGLQ